MPHISPFPFSLLTISTSHAVHTSFTNSYPFRIVCISSNVHFPTIPSTTPNQPSHVVRFSRLWHKTLKTLLNNINNLTVCISHPHHHPFMQLLRCPLSPAL